MKRRFLILQLRPEDETSDNEFEALLKYGGLTEDDVHRIRIEHTGIPDITLDEYAGIIVGGSPFDISTPKEKKSENQKKVEADFKKLLDEVVARDFPFLGACSGAGLLGNYCGAHISGTYGEPVEWLDIILTDEGKKDPLLKGFPETFRALAGHKEACDEVPPGAVLLARSEACPVHMFRVGDNVYATQFHPEADPEGFTLRIGVYKHHGYFKPEEAEELTKAVQKETNEIPWQILRRFVERYQSV